MIISGLMDKYGASESLYADFEVNADIVINSPRGSFTKEKLSSALNAILDEVKCKNLRDWFFVEDLKGDCEGPGSALLENFYKTLKTLECKRVILIADVPALQRLVVINALSSSGMEFNFMPNMESALSWIRYLKICEGNPSSYFSYTSY